jgi:hypothetical protein
MSEAPPVAPSELRRDLPPLPARIAKLPVHRGYPVPWFVAWIDGVPDFRIISENKIAVAHNQARCWICGERLGSYLAFVVGPMCAVNRISAELPSHRECAEFAAIACPFLSRPHMVRRDAGLPTAGVVEPAGTMIRRNPGVALVWITRSYRVQKTETGPLFEMGAPLEIACYTEGRRSTPEEIRHSVETGLPLLLEAANQEATQERRDRARLEVERETAVALRLLGAA